MPTRIRSPSRPSGARSIPRRGLAAKRSRAPSSRSWPPRSPRCRTRSAPCSARDPRPTVSDVGSTKSGALRVGRRARAVHRRPSGLRLGGARPRARERRALRGRDVVPHAGRRDRAGALQAPARLRRLARGDSGGDRPGCARPAHGGDEPPAARAREPHPQPRGLGAGERARAARNSRRLAPGHDARRRGESADLDRHLPRQRRGASRSRWPSTAGASRISSALSRRGDAGWLARWIGEAAVNRRTLLDEAYPDVGALQRCACTCPTGRGSFRGSPRRSAPSRSTSRTSSSSTCRPSAAGPLRARLGRGRGASRGRLLEAQGYSVIVSPAFEDE